MNQSLCQGTGLISPELYAEINLQGINPIRIYDHSRVYFGDYYHVKLEVVCTVPLPEKIDNSGHGDVKSPDEVVYRRFLEKMAVPSAAIEDVRQALLTEFRNNSLHYLTAADFPAKLAASRDGQPKSARKRYVSSH